MSQSLAVKYRPKKFDEVIGQKSTLKILQRQLEYKKFPHCYLFCGGSGTGKTTIARALATAINGGRGNPIEIDAASNSGVDAVRDIISQASERSIDSEYKIFIIDECHSLSNTAWQAFLKCIEEPPEYTIFIFCTTNPEKIPATIVNRVMRFNFSKVDSELIYQRLLHICQQEGFTNYQEACDFISKVCQGGVRDAISMLEKCSNYDVDLSIDNVLSCIGNFSYSSMFDLTVSLYNGDEADVLQRIDEYYNSGNDLKVFVEQYFDFILDLTKYCLFKNIKMVKIPQYLETRCQRYSEIPDIVNYSNLLINTVLDIKKEIRYDVNSRTTVEAMFVEFMRKFTVQ